MKNKRGISLIVLVITIIIIIILAGAVILNLADNNPIESASEAKIVSDLDAFKSDLTIQIGKKYLENTMLKAENIDSSLDEESEWYLTKLVPTIKGTDYEDNLIVENGELKLRIDSKLDKSTKEIIEKNLGKAVLTASMILAAPQEYIGRKVNYVIDTEKVNGQTIDWRIFGIDEETGNILLRTNDYVDLDYKTLDSSRVELGQDSTYCISGKKSREDFINYLNTSSNWSEYAIEGTMAKGALTLKQFVDSYNLVNEKKLEIEFLKEENEVSTDDMYTAKSAGYVVRKADGEYGTYVSDLSETINGLNYYIALKENEEVFWYQLSSVSAAGTNFVVHVGGGTDISASIYNHVKGGICPAVYLITANIVQDAKGNFLIE